MENHKMKVFGSIKALEIFKTYLVRLDILDFYDLLPSGTADYNVTIGLENGRVFEAPVRLGSILDYMRLMQSHSMKNEQECITFAVGQLDAMHGVYLKDGVSIKLTEKEVEILLHLHAENGKTIARTDLLEAVWGYSQDMDTHTVETHVYRLRQKIESNPSLPEILITEENGYSVRLF